MTLVAVSSRRCKRVAHKDLNAIDNEPVTQLDFYSWLAGILGKERPKVEPENPMRPRGLTNKRVSNAKLREELEYTFEFPDFRSG